MADQGTWSGVVRLCQATSQSSTIGSDSGFDTEVSDEGM